MIGYTHTPVSYFISMFSAILFTTVGTLLLLFPSKVDGWGAMLFIFVIWLVSSLLWLGHLNQHREKLAGKS